MIRVKIEKIIASEPEVINGQLVTRTVVARRTLDIRRETPRGRDDESVGIYTVLLGNGIRYLARGSFEHRYGDDLLSLVHEAIDSLGGAGIGERRRQEVTR